MKYNVFCTWNELSDDKRADRKKNWSISWYETYMEWIPIVNHPTEIRIKIINFMLLCYTVTIPYTNMITFYMNKMKAKNSIVLKLQQNLTWKVIHIFVDSSKFA